MRNVAALLTGLLFGIGLIISGMSNPAKVLAFLTISSSWDPSLLLVMISGLAVAGTGYLLIGRLSTPIFADTFQVPTNQKIDKRLLVGAALFGLGWGLIGLCPGPALTALTIGRVDIMAFVAAMIIGMSVVQLAERAYRRE